MRLIILRGVGFLTLLLWALAAQQAMRAGDVRVTSRRVLAADGGRLSWLRSGNIIAYDKLGVDGYYNVWTIHPDGTNDTCLTCQAAALPPLNKGNPVWRPSGNFIAFQAQNVALGGAQADVLARPGSGWNNDLWIMDAAGRNFWRITNEPSQGGVVHPQFSWAGDKLVYAERLSTTPEPYGTWQLVLVDFVISPAGVPSVQNRRTFTPGIQKYYYEPHGFSTDDKTLFFMAYLEPNQTSYGMDIYSLQVDTGELARLTDTMNQWDEFPTPMPSGARLVWSSTMDTSSKPSHFECDLWMMNYDGSDKYRLTFFNDPDSPDYMPNGICPADPDWNASGTQLAVYANLGLGPRFPGTVWLLDLEPANATVSAASYARPPLAPDSIVATFGPNLARDVVSSGAPLATSLGGTTVSVTDARGTQRPALLYFVSPTQINLVIPAGTGPGPAVFTVTNPDGVQSRGTVSIKSVSPALYTMNADGKGVVAAYILRLAPDGSSTTEPVYSCTGGAGTCTTRAIDVSSPTDRIYLVMFGTGFQGRSSLENVSVSIGRENVTPLYAGPQGQYPGFDQMNVQLSRSLAGAGVVDVVVTVDGVASNTVQIQAR